MMIFVFLIFFNIFYFIKYLADASFPFKNLPLRKLEKQLATDCADFHGLDPSVFLLYFILNLVKISENLCNLWLT